MTWQDDSLINDICTRLHGFAGDLMSIAHEADEIENNLQMLCPGNISTVIAEVMRKMMCKKYAKDDEEQ
jgi:hypothetical protein